MGLHNRITENKYNDIKYFLKDNRPKYVKLENLDEAASEMFGVSPSSVRNIRLTNDYQEYCERVFRFHGHPKGKSMIKTERWLKQDQDNDDSLLLWEVSKHVSSLDLLCMQLDGDHQAIMENQLNISRRLRIYIILDCVLVFIMAATIALLAWKGCGY